MGLLHPGALFSLLAVVPALILAYLARERPARVTVSSVLAFRALRGPRAERFRRPPALQLDVLRGAADPVAGGARDRRSLRDHPAAPDRGRARQFGCDARGAGSGRTRFEAARDRLVAALARESGAGQITVYVTAPEPHRFADPFERLADARSAIGRVEPTDAPGDPQALTTMLGELASGARFASVIFAGDNPLDTALATRLHPITVGNPIANYAIGSFVLRRESFGAQAMRARVTVANFSPGAQTLEVALSGDGHPLGRAQARLAAGEAGTIDFPSLATAQVYRAELTPRDDFPLDNVAYATTSAIKSVSILFVSPTPDDAAGLSGLPGVEVRVRSPDQFSPDDLSRADLAIFEYAVPKEMPSVNALLVTPPPADPIFDFATAPAPAGNVQVTGWRTPDPLTDSVNFRLIQPRGGEYFAVHPWMAPVVSGSLGGLLLAGERQDRRFVAVGFNPFPYLGRHNLAMSVLTLNMLSYLAGLSSDTVGYRTGDPWPVPAGVTRIVLPSGRGIAVKPGALFTDTSEQGVYQLSGLEGSKTLRAVNLADLTASNLEDLVTLRPQSASSPTSGAVFTRRVPLDGWLLGAILALASAEAIAAYRRRRPAYPDAIMSWSLVLRELSLSRPDALYLLVPVAIFAGWSLRQHGATRRVIPPILRAIVLALFALALAGPASVYRHEGTTRPTVIDDSNSITGPMRSYIATMLSDRLKLRPQDPAVIFAGAAVSSTVGNAIEMLRAPNRCIECQPGATDLEAALDRLASDPEAAGGPAVLLTDGWENHGDADRALAALVAARIRLYVFTPPGAEDMPNVAMTALTLPGALSKSEPFALGVTLSNLNPVKVAGTISLYENDRLISERPVELPPGQQRFDFPVRSEDTGLISYRADFKPADPSLDIYPEDDSLQGWVGIGARRRVLILTDAARDASYLETVVRRLGLEPTVVTLAGKQFGGSPSGYDAVVLDNVPRSRLTPAADGALSSYVEHGGSLAMVGGDQSFGLGGYEGSDIAKVMPVVMKPPQRKEPQRALVLIIDKSGSMGRDNKLVYAKAAARTVTKALKDDDLVSVIGFDSQPFVVVPLEPLSESRPYMDQMIDRLKARGTTFLLPALKEAERTLAASGASVKHVVILTDGETGGTADQYYDLVASMHHDGGATISTIAVGREANLRLLTAISKYGGGAFYQTDSPSDLPELFLEDVRQHGGELTMVENEFAPKSPAPDAVLKDLAGRQLPPLKGYVSTDLKPHASIDLFVDRNGRREPLIASWKYGAGKSLAVTTDASGRWSAPWISGGVFGQVWDRLFTWMTPESTEAQNFDVALGYRGGRLEIKLTDYGANPEREANLVSAIVSGPGGVKNEQTLSEESPGELSGSVEAPRAGTYYITLKSTPNSKERTFPPLAYTVSAAAFAETPRPDPNYGLLEHLSSATAGRLNPNPDEVALARPMLERRAPLSAWPIAAAIFLLIAEALIRRLTF